MSKKKSHYRKTDLVFEELEPRLLLSADPLAVATDAGTAAVEELVLDNYEDHSALVQTTTEQAISSVRTELVIIDSRAPNHQQLYNDLIKAQQQGRNIHVVVLDAHRDGIEQINEALANYDKLDAVHIVSHGDDGQLQLGATQLNKTTLRDHASDISNWKDRFSDNGDLLIYGCNMAESQDGKSLVDALSFLTATDVAASDDLTGNKLLGGDWELEYEAGEIESTVAFSEDVQQNWQGTLEGATASAEQEKAPAEEQQQEQQAQLELSEQQAVINEEEQAAISKEEEQQATIAEEQRQEVVFIDESVSDFQAFIDDLQANSNSSATFEIILLDSDKNGIDQINETLSSYNEVDALHIISHGYDGTVKLGNTWLSVDNLVQHSDSLAAWSGSLTQDADILIYGCNLAESVQGEQFVAELAQLTGADVAASNDITGHASLGGDWDLEYKAGVVETEVAFSEDARQSWASILNTFVVTSTADSGVGSLRQAILDANSNVNGGTPDLITFNIAGAGPHIINLASALPAITEAVVIDVTTEPDYAGNPVVRIEGASAGGGVNGITFAADSDNSVLRGLMITNFSDYGIQVDAGADGITIANNWIGTTGTGSTGVGNSNSGINIQGANTIVGGSGANEGNVITNNGNEGINITGAGATGTIIRGNIIGLDPDGSTGSGNTDVGIAVLSGAHNTIIGGTTAAERNVISNNFEGIEINSNNNIVQGNYIGTDITGTFDRGNRSDDGVEIQNNTSGNLIGGTAAGAGNLIAFNARDGVYVVNGTGNAVLGNRIHSNTGLGIDLGANGVSANDANDVDTGANNLQNFPVLSSADTNTVDTIAIDGTINSTASSYFRIEFFASSAADGSGHGEGENYLGFVNVATDASGNGSFSATLSAAVANGAAISATATGSDMTYTTFTNTSEFAANINAVANSAPILWDYHHTIDLAAATAIADYPVQVQLTEGVNGFNHANAQANGEDIRFYDIAGNELSYWIEDWNNAGTSTIWVKVANAGSTSIEMYYGNAGVTGASDPTAIFLFHDDFEDGDAAGWTVVAGAASGTAPYVLNDAGNQVYSDGANSGGPVVSGSSWSDVAVSHDFRTINPGDPINHAGLIARYQDANNMVYGGIVTASSAEIWYKTTASGSFVQIGGDWDISAFNVDDGNWHTQELRLFGDTVELYIDDTFIGSASLAATGAPASGQTGFWSQYSSREAYRDNHIVRSYESGTGDIATTQTNEGFVIDEHSANGAYVGYVIATDANVSNVLSYSITGGNTGGAFAIDASTGEITVNNSAAVDFETTPVFNLTVQVADGVGGIDTDNVTITLNDVNDVPVATANTVTTTEDNTYTFSSADFTFSDVEGDSLVSATITNLSLAGGALTHSVGTTVNSGDTLTAAQLSTLIYTPLINTIGSPLATFDFTVNDTGSGVTTAQMDIDVTAVNDVPVNTVPGTQTVLEDTQTAIAGISVSDPDAGVNVITTQLSVSNGVLDVTLAGAATISAGANGSNTFTLSGNVTDINASLVSLQYTANANVNGIAADSLSIVTNDLGNAGAGGAQSDSDSVQIDITAVNDAPVLVAANDLNAISEDPLINTGTLVSDLISGHVSDVDSGALSGIAVVGVDNTNGAWEYTMDGGSNWLSFGSPSSNSATLLAADVNTRVRFVPNANYNGTVNNGISFHAWDQTTGNNGDVLSISGCDSVADGFSTVSYSNSDGTMPWTSDWIESDTNGGGASGGYASINGGSLQLQLAAGNGGDNIYRELDLSGSTTATLSFDYQNDLFAEDEIRVQVSSNGGASYTTVLTFSGTLNTGSGTANIDISSYIASDTRIRLYVFKNDGGNNLYIDNIDINFDNGDPLPGGTTAFSSATASSSITVNPVNDVPNARDDRVGLLFDGVDDYVTIGDYAGLNVTTNVTMEAWIKPTGLGSGSKIIINKEGEYEMAINATTGELMWAFDNIDPDWGWHYTGYFVQAGEWTHLTVSYNNGVVDTFANGVLVDSYNGSGAITDNYPAFNQLQIGGRENAITQRFDGHIDEIRIWNTTRTQLDIQTNMNTLLTGAEPGLIGNWRFDEGSGVTVEDQSVFAHHGTLADGVTVGEMPAWQGYVVSEEGTLSVSAVNGVLANDYDIDGDALIAVLVTGPTNAAAFSLNPDGSFTYTPAANFNGVDTFTYRANDGSVDSNIATVTIRVDPVNDVPVAIASTVSTTEDNAYSFSTVDFTYFDTEGDSLVSATITNLTLAGGTLTHSSGTSVNSGDTLTAAQLNTLVYTPLANATGTPLSTFDFSVNDTGAGVTTAQMSINVTVVNDVPEAIASTVSTTEDNAYSFSTVDFTYFDTEGDGLVSAAISNLSLAAGTLTHSSGTTVNNGNTLTAAQLNTLVYTPLANANGTPLATFDFTVNDAGFGTVSAQMSINVTAQADTAVIGGVDSGAVTEDDDPDTNNLLEVSGALTIIDPDAGEAVFNAGAIGGSYGVITLNAAGGWSYAAINNQPAVQSLAAGATLTDTITISSADGTTHDIVITIMGTNDVPVAGNDVASVNEGGSVLIAVAANDSDIDNALDLNSIIITGLPSNGSVVVNGDGTVSYTHDGSETLVDSFGYTISDISGAISNTATVTLSINPVNDAPTTSGIADVSVNEDAASTNIDLNAAFADSDNLDSELTYSILGNNNIGLFSATGIDNSTGQLTLDYAADMNGAAQISIRASDPSGSFVDTLFSVNVAPVNDNPMLQANTGVLMTGMAPATISSAELNVTDIDNLDSELLYTITELPAHGDLMRNGAVLAVNETFTQAELDSNLVVYTARAALVADQFGFTVSDNAGGALANNTFNIIVQLNQDNDDGSTSEPPPGDTQEEEDTREEDTGNTDSGGSTAGAGGFGGGYEPFGSTSVPPPPAPAPVLNIDPPPQPVPEQETPVEPEQHTAAEIEQHEVSTFAAVQVKSIDALWSAIDKMKQEMADSADEKTTTVEFQVAAAKSSGVVLTAGVVAWILRSGALLSSLLSTIPLWKGYDPLPILAYKDDDKDKIKEAEIDEHTIPTSLEDLRKLKKLMQQKQKKAKEVDVDSMFGNSTIRE